MGSLACLGVCPLSVSVIFAREYLPLGGALDWILVGVSLVSLFEAQPRGPRLVALWMDDSWVAGDRCTAFLEIEPFTTSFVFSFLLSFDLGRSQSTKNH